MNDEILAGLKNAMERGSSLDQAVSSFINAGYNQMEVQQAANSLKSGASVVVNEPSDSNPQQPQNMKQPPQSMPVPQGQTAQDQVPQAPKTPDVTGNIQTSLPQPSQNQQPQQQTPQAPKKSFSKGTKILIVGLILLLVLVIIGIISIIFFKDALLGLLST